MAYWSALSAWFFSVFFHSLSYVMSFQLVMYVVNKNQFLLLGNQQFQNLKLLIIENLISLTCLHTFENLIKINWVESTADLTLQNSISELEMAVGNQKKKKLDISDLWKNLRQNFYYLWSPLWGEGTNWPRLQRKLK